MTALRLKAAAAAAVALANILATAEVPFRNNLMPQPAEISVGSGALPLRATFAVQLPGASDRLLADAVDRAVRRIELTAGLRHAGRGVAGTTPLVVRVDHPAPPVQTLEDEESYSLKVTPAGAEIDAPGDLGAMHGLETLIQLVQPGDGAYVIPSVTIQDAPRFRWRGLMIDCGRHFEPVPVLERMLDGMAAVKLNVFHWHLTEDQGFRIESLVYPRLTGQGSDGLFYTQEDARHIVAYARARGIRVVPEFEMPGHSTAWLYAYPQLASGTRPEEIRREFGVSPYAIDPTREETYEFIRRFLTEMTRIFPDAYVHIGGDETPAPDWKTDPRIQAFMRAHHLRDNAALQGYFNTRILGILAGLHRHMMGWDEILTPDLPRDVVVQSWRGEESLATAARQGNRGVLSAPYYLDGMRPAGVHYLADPLPATSTLTPAERRLILGGEVCMWGEHLYAGTIDSRVWPRTAAIAERFWSPAPVRDVDDMYRRLAAVSLELEGVGLTHLQSGDAGLRSLAGTEDIGALRTFASVLEPVSFGERAQTERTDQLTPLDAFVDAVRPDPPSRHRFQLEVKRLLADPEGDAADRAALSGWFRQLAESAPAVEEQARSSPRLAGISVRAGQLAELAAMGEQALEYLGGSERAPEGWAERQRQTLAAIGRPSALVRFTILDGMTTLVQAVR